MRATGRCCGFSRLHALRTHGFMTVAGAGRVRDGPCSLGNSQVLPSLGLDPAWSIQLDCALIFAGQ